MSETIYKTPLACALQQDIPMPHNAEVLSLQTQNGVPCIWWRTPFPMGPVESAPGRRFYTHGTGHMLHEDVGRFIGTYQLDGGRLVFHVFEEKRHV